MDKPKFEACIWNGNEIVKASEPNKGIAGIAHDTEEEWGPMFAAAPEMYEALKEAVSVIESMKYKLESLGYIPLFALETLCTISKALARAEGNAK